MRIHLPEAGSRNRTDQRSSPRPSLRFVLVAAVNLPLAVLVACFLPYEYQRELTERVENKQISLEEEAKTLLPAILELRHHGIPVVQRYIDTVCGQMQNRKSPGHHIAVRLPDSTVQATSHGRDSTEMLAALERAANSPNHGALLGNKELVVGSASADDGTTTYVAETLANVKQSVHRSTVRRLLGLIALFLIAAAIVNVVLLWAVTNPIQTLVATVQQIGRGQFGVRPPTFRSAELNYLATEIDTMSQSLASAERERKRQLAKAREIQQGLLPKDLKIQGLRIAHLFKPAEDIGGDFFDVVSLKDGTWLLCVADVTGHGIPAAMSAAMLKMLLQEAAETHTSPAMILNVVNRRFSVVSLPEDFVSMILVRLDPQSRRVYYSSAGHEPGWLISGEDVQRELKATGLLLGIDATTTWEEVVLDVAEGDRIFVVTDGVSESFDSNGRMFGRTELVQMLSRFRQLTVDDSVGQIEKTLKTYRNNTPQLDDVTAVVLEIVSNG